MTMPLSDDVVRRLGEIEERLRFSAEGRGDPSQMLADANYLTDLRLSLPTHIANLCRREELQARLRNRSLLAIRHPAYGGTAHHHFECALCAAEWKEQSGEYHKRDCPLFSASAKAIL